MKKVFDCVPVDAKLLWTKRYIETHLDLDEDDKQQLYLTALEADLPNPKCDDLSIPKTYLYRIFDDMLATAKKDQEEQKQITMAAGIFVDDAEITRDLRLAQFLFDTLFG